MKIPKISATAWLLILITIAGAALRLYNLGEAAFWLDEAATVYFASLDPSQIWSIFFVNEPNPPTFYLVEHYLVHLEPQEFWMRIVPCLFGIASIPAIYYMGKTWVDEHTGLLMAALLAFSQFHIFYSQEARAYSIALFISLVGLIIYKRGAFGATTNDSTRKSAVVWLLLGIIFAVGYYFHLYVVVLFGALIIVSIIKRANIISVVIGGVTWCIATLPLNFAATALFEHRLSEGLQYGVNAFEFPAAVIQQFTGFSAYALVPLAILFVLGLYWCISERDEGTALLFEWFVIGFVVMATSVALALYIPMLPRYIIFLLPFFFMMVACGCNLIIKKAGRTSLYIILIGFLVINAPALTGYYNEHPKDDWRGAAGAVYNLTRPGDIIVVSPWYLGFPFMGYHDDVLDQTATYTHTPLSDVKNISGKQDRVFFVFTRDDLAVDDPSGETVKWIESNADKMATTGRVEIWKKHIPSRCSACGNK